MTRFFAFLGETIERAVLGAGETLDLLFESTLYVRHAWKRRRFLLDQFYTCGIRPLPVVLVVALFTGMILALQTGLELEKFGAKDRIAAIIGVSLCREMGPFMTAIILTASVGSGMAAELGTMKVTEQVDALETLAYDPQSYLVVPRVLAATLMFPVIVAFSIAIGVVTGWLTSLALLELSTPDFIKGLKLFYVFKDVWFGLLKSASFGCTIALVGCVVGLSTRGGAEGVGRATTRSVVYSAILILVLDAFWAVVLL